MKKYSWEKVEQLVRQAQGGDKEAMEELMKAFKNYIYKSAMHIYVSGYDQDDLMQLGYMTVMKAAQQYDVERSNFVNYVTLAITNNFRALIRNRAKDNAVGSLDADLGEGFSIGNILLDEGVNIEEDYVNEELGKMLEEAIEGLPFKLQEIIKYVYIDEKGNFKEYAKECGINYNTVIKRKNLAFEKLRRALKARKVI
ncbi:MAG: sigma-70 family RNA polymerase sigma factor [Clostridium sp.]